jgi:hypothetical protein
MIDLNSRTALTDRINYLIDEQILYAASKEPPREYLGASVIGNQCERQVQYQYMATRGDVERKAIPARTLRIFDRGNIYEDRARTWLKKAGFLFGRTRKGKSFTDFDGKFRGHVDGILTGWGRPDLPCPVVLPCLWECKCLASKYWKQLKENKLEKYSATYYGQVQIYMSYIGLEQCLFTAVNADDMQVYHELVPFNETEAMLLRSRVQTVITATEEGKLLQRLSDDPAFYICRWCDFHGVCHSK